jgi:hypothetical protein
MTATILACIFALCAVAALGGWAATLVNLNRSILPNAQALQALNQVNNIMDDRIRAVLANFEKQRSRTVEPTAPVEDQLAEVRRRAQMAGFDIDGQGTVRQRTVRAAPEPLVPEFAVPSEMVE